LPIWQAPVHTQQASRISVKDSRCFALLILATNNRLCRTSHPDCQSGIGQSSASRSAGKTFTTILCRGVYLCTREVAMGIGSTPHAEPTAARRGAARRGARVSAAIQLTGNREALECAFIG
jgi:hypothetical protein